MDLNSTDFNNTVNQVIDYVDLVNAIVNDSDVIVDSYEEYRQREKNRLVLLKGIACVLGILIALCNLSVVVSSGLILKRGQRPKSTYLLLGNIALADTIVGFAIVYCVTVEYTLSSKAMCIFQQGLLVCPAMVSIFSVGLIAVDRYIYILHGLYYHRWFNTTRVRIGILLIWMIGITLGFMPATGWVSQEIFDYSTNRCYYVSLFPGGLVLLNSALSIVPIVVVAVLYAFILVKALQTVGTIQNTVKIKEESPANEEPKLRMNRRTVNVKSSNNIQSVQTVEKNDNKIKRSASFDIKTSSKPKVKVRSKSIEDLCANKTNRNNLVRDIERQSKIHFESDFSVCTVESGGSFPSFSIEDSNNKIGKFIKRSVSAHRIREPNKWRAVIVVMLTSGSVIVTWLPFFITVIFFVLCEEQINSPKCFGLRALVGGPLAILAFVNSVLNPLIYAWWHKGFQKSVRSYYMRYLHKYICRIIR